MAARLFLIVLLASAACATALEEPEFTLLAERDGYEIRLYSPYLVAETVVESSFESSGDEAFRRLFGFISGDNREAASIEMTAPVVSGVEPGGGEKIEMTAPVISGAPQRKADGVAAYAYQFVMPARYTLETLPAPIDPRVTVRQIPQRLVAVRRFTGRWSEANYRRSERALLEALARDGVELAGDPVFARYNGPFTPWFLRRNEVMARIEAASLPAADAVP